MCSESAQAARLREEVNFVGMHVMCRGKVEVGEFLLGSVLLCTEQAANLSRAAPSH